MRPIDRESKANLSYMNSFLLQEHLFKQLKMSDLNIDRTPSLQSQENLVDSLAERLVECWCFPGFRCSYLDSHSAGQLEQNDEEDGHIDGGLHLVAFMT